MAFGKFAILSVAAPSTFLAVFFLKAFSGILSRVYPCVPPALYSMFGLVLLSVNKVRFFRRITEEPPSSG